MRVAGAGRIYAHDRKLPPAAGPYPPIHPRRATRVRGLPGRGPGHVPAQQERHRPADLPVALRRRLRDRTADRRSRRPQLLRRRGSAAGGEEAPGAGPRAGRRHRVVRRRRGRADGRLQPGGPGLRGGPCGRCGWRGWDWRHCRGARRPWCREDRWARGWRGGGATRTDVAGSGAGSAAGPVWAVGGLRERRGAAGREPGRGRRGRHRGPGGRGAGGRAGEQRGRDVRAGRIHRGRGDGPHPGLLVGAGRHRGARCASRRDPGHALVHRRSRQPGTVPGRSRLPGRGHAQRGRLADPGRTGRPAHDRRLGPGGVPLPGDRLLGR